jgi:hypothetical protein
VLARKGCGILGGHMNKVVCTLLAAFAVTLVSSLACAQAQVRVRGTIEKAEGSLLTVKTRDGAELKIKLTDNAKVLGIAKISLADIKPGSFVGSAAVPMPDGNLKALEVHVFPEDMRGTGEGHRPFDLAPNSTMTNATVVDAVMDKDGKTLNVKYKDGEKKIVVTEATPVVTYVPGGMSDLKPGVKIIIFAGTKLDDGTIEANRINFGKDGLTPPM